MRFEITRNDLTDAMNLFKFLCGDSPQFNYLVIEGEPYSKARPRFSGGKVYNTQKQKNNENYLKHLMRLQIKEPYPNNLAVGMIFYRSSKQRIDVDNMIKNVMDAANGIIFIDDCQVTAKFGVVELDKDNPRTVIVYGHHKTTMIRELTTTLVCKHCKKEFKPNGFGQKHPFCSIKCANQSRLAYSKDPIKCGGCGNDFVKKTKNQIYCSSDCRMKGMKERNQGKRIHEKAFCDVCGKELSRPTYKRCRSCWSNRGGKDDGQAKKEAQNGKRGQAKKTPGTRGGIRKRL